MGGAEHFGKRAGNWRAGFDERRENTAERLDTKSLGRVTRPDNRRGVFDNHGRSTLLLASEHQKREHQDRKERAHNDWNAHGVMTPLPSSGGTGHSVIFFGVCLGELG